MKLRDRFLVRMGFGIIAADAALSVVPFHSVFSLVGWAIKGLGCAPMALLGLLLGMLVAKKIKADSA